MMDGNAAESPHREARRRHTPCQRGGGVLSSVGVGRIKEERLPPCHRGVGSLRLTVVVNSEMNNRDAKVNNERLLTSAATTMSLKNQLGDAVFLRTIGSPKSRGPATEPSPTQAAHG